MALKIRDDLMALLPAGNAFSPVSTSVLEWTLKRRKAGDLAAAVLNVDELAAAFFQRLDGTLSNELRLVAEPDDPRAEKALALVEEQLLSIKQLSRKLGVLLSAVGHGLAALELLWEQNGPGWKLVDLREVDIRNLGRDDERNIIWRDFPYDYPEEKPWNGGRIIHPYKLAVFSLSEKDFRGRGALEFAFISARGLFFLRRFGLMTCERFGAPTIIGGRDGAQAFGGTKDWEDEAWKFLQAIRANATALRPQGLSLDIIEAQLRGSQGGLFEFLERSFIKSIQKVVLGQTLTSEQGDRGALALGRVHENVRADKLQSDSKDLCEVVGEQIVDRILALNGFDAGLVKADIVIPESVNLLERADFVAKVRNEVRIPLSQKFVRDFLGELPEPESDEDTLKPGESGMSALGVEIGKQLAAGALGGQDTDFGEGWLEA